MQERELRTVAGHLQLKREVIHCLIRCHICAGNFKEVVKLCSRALEQCSQERHDEDNLRWQAYFIMQMAQCKFAATGSVVEALATLEKMNDISDLRPEERCVAALGRAICHFHSNALSEADSALSEMAAIIEEAHKAELPLSDVSGNLLSELQGLYFVMYTIVAQSMGRAGSLKGDGDYPVFSHLQEALTDVSESASSPCWLSASAASALGHMIHSSVLRAAGKGSEAALQLGQAEEILDATLTHHGIVWEKTETDIAASMLIRVRVLVLLRLVALEHRTLAALLSTDLSNAVTSILALSTALERYPSILRCRQPSIAMIIGQYAHITGEYEIAASLFGALAMNSCDSAMKRLAAASVALVELQRHSGKLALSEANKWLELEGSMDSAKAETHVLASADRMAMQLVRGIILKEQGDAIGARVILTKALKYAHGLIGSMQLVGQLLNALAPVQLEKNDVSGAQQMFQSAITLFKSINDLPSLITTLHGLHDLHQKQGKIELVSKSEQYLARKEQGMHERILKVRASEDHTNVMAAAAALMHGHQMKQS